MVECLVVSLQVLEGPEPLAASLHDAGLDLLGGHDHQGRGAREGDASQGDHEDHGAEQWDPLAQLVPQQLHPLPP